MILCFEQHAVIAVNDEFLDLTERRGESRFAGGQVLQQLHGRAVEEIVPAIRAEHDVHDAQVVRHMHVRCGADKDEMVVETVSFPGLANLLASLALTDEKKDDLTMPLADRLHDLDKRFDRGEKIEGADEPNDQPIVQAKFASYLLICWLWSEGALVDSVRDHLQFSCRRAIVGEVSSQHVGDANHLRRSAHIDALDSAADARITVIMGAEELPVLIFYRGFAKQHERQMA